ncbi:MAG: FimB/Mfa2 family fimbrial subunit [Dysgonomonas sp.]|nr:FimB/Mfa2 family fimbrial subunit [Dysgonomonas sp.]
MKLLKALSIIILLALSGCIGDNMDDCPPVNNVILYFEYPNFPERINRVNVGIFNKNGLHVMDHQVEKTDLDILQGIQLTLNNGEYTAVCWGNAFDDTRITCFNPNSSMHDGELSHPNYGTSVRIPTHDSITFGRLNFFIKSKDKVSHTVNMKPAHIKIHVYVKGLAILNTNPAPADYPAIRINNLDPAYDFEMINCGTSSSYHPEVEVDNTLKLAIAKCNTLRFEDDNPITVDVLTNSASNNILHTVNLKKFMEDNNINVVDGEELTIPILITFGNGTVTVTLLSWEGIGVTPGK